MQNSDLPRANANVRYEHEQLLPWTLLFENANADITFEHTFIAFLFLS